MEEYGKPLTILITSPPHSMISTYDPSFSSTTIYFHSWMKAKRMPDTIMLIAFGFKNQPSNNH